MIAQVKCKNNYSENWKVSYYIMTMNAISYSPIEQQAISLLIEPE